MSKHDLTMYLYNRAIESAHFVTALRESGFDWELRDKFLDHADNMIAAGQVLQNLEV